MSSSSSNTVCFVCFIYLKLVFYLQTLQQNNYDNNPYAKEFGISIDNKLASVEARVLPPPWVIFTSLNFLPFVYFRHCVDNIFWLFLLLTVEISRHWKRERILATSWSVEHDEQGQLRREHIVVVILLVKEKKRKTTSS